MAVLQNRVVQWCFAVVYASIVLAHQEELWSYLKSLGGRWEGGGVIWGSLGCLEILIRWCTKVIKRGEPEFELKRLDDLGRP